MRNWARIERNLDNKTLGKIKADTGSTLFARTMLVLAGLLVITGLTSTLTMGLTLSGWVTIPLFITLMVLVLISAAMAEKGKAMALIPASIFAALFGLMLSPYLTMKIETLGVATVTITIAMTTGIMAACGLVASVFTIPYRKLEGPLLAALFGLIIVGCFMAVGTVDAAQINFEYSILGAIVFVLYFLIDFARLYHRARAGAKGWGEATSHAINLYLDYLNLLIHLLGASEG